MTSDQASDILQSLSRLETKMELLITNGGSKGLIPEMRRDVDKHDRQINFWRGALAITGFLLLLFGGAFLTHIFGKSP